MNPEITKRQQTMSYRNFNVSIYCPVSDVNRITDLEEFDQKFTLFTQNIHVGRVYLECYRGMEWTSKEQLLKLKSYFQAKGIATSGGITTNDDAKGEGFLSLCYSSGKGAQIVTRAARLCAELFDEIILDDFYFANCRCPECIKVKGSRSWSQMRLEQKMDISRQMIGAAKEVNPNVNFIIKYPQWYEYYTETGYHPGNEPALFDSIYTGTETRNPTYAQQHLPKYLSYFIMRYLESAAPGRNLGGWFDPYECNYNLTSYLEQGYLTLFGKAKEITLFCLGSLLNNPDFRIFVPAIGQMFSELDPWLDRLGTPCGAAAYRPVEGRGEDYLHNYLGMCGIPLEGTIHYPEHAQTIFLAESAFADPDIISKMHESLMNGSDVIVTSGFLRKAGQKFRDTFVNVSCSERKAFVNQYANSKDNGLTVSGSYTGTRPILIPQLDYCTNDIWELAAAYGTDNNFPIVLRCRYGNGRLSIITIPDDMGDLYTYPAQVLNVIRGLLQGSLSVRLEGPAQAMLFVYDNNTFIVRSDLPYDETFTLVFDEKITGLKRIGTDKEIPLTNHRLELRLSPASNLAFEMI